ADAFNRYLPPLHPRQPRQRNENNSLEEKQTAPAANGGADENAPNPLKSRGCRGGADETPQSGDARECADDLPAANGGADENKAASEQPRQATARALKREADRRGADLNLDKDGNLKRRDVPLDPAFLMKLREYKPDIIAMLQNGGGWND